MMVALVVVVGVGMAVHQAISPAQKGGSTAPRLGPPPGAQFVEESPEQIVGEVGAARKGRREAVIESYVGLWVPNDGWSGVVESISQEREGPALRLHRPSSTLIGGGCWVIALVNADHGIENGQHVWVQGRISDVKFQAGAATVAMSVVLEEARVVRKH
jgi:hypothetical protein